jgi:hypothetical protein
VQTWFVDKEAVLRRAAERAQRMQVTAYTKTIYPGDMMPPVKWDCNLPDEDLIRRGDDLTNPKWFELKLISPILVICVDYKLSFAEQRHQTWDVYSIDRKTVGKTSGYLAMIPIDGDIPIEELEMSRVPVGGTFAN